MAVSLDLLINAIVAGILLGGFYAAVTVGITITFGMLDIANIAQPAFILLGSYAAYIITGATGLDPILTGVLMLPVFFVVGMIVYQLYYHAFESRGEQSIQGLAFLFGLLFVGEVSLILAFGVDYRFVEAPYIGPSYNIGPVSLPVRMLIPFLASVLLLIGLQLFFTRTFNGRAIMAVAQDKFALQLMGAAPVRIKRIAFGLSTATAAMAGSFLIILQPVEPSMGRDYIGRIFAICVLGGIGSLPGTFIAAVIVGVAESITATFYGPSWSPAIAFGFLLIALVVRPAGLFGRA